MVSSDIRINDCSDGFLQDNGDCLLWIERLAIFINEKLGPSPRLRLGAYRAGSTYVTIDGFETLSDEKCVVITIYLSQSKIDLPILFDEQLDLGLPGVVDALCFLEVLLKKTGGTLLLAKFRGKN